MPYATIGLGAVQFGLDYGIANDRGQTPAPEVARILDLCAASGLTVVDTAAAYGTSEEVLGGLWQQHLPQSRLISKLRPPCEGWDPAAELAETFRRLQTEHLYGYIYHDCETYFQVPESLEVMRAAKAAGRIEKIGFSVYTPEQTERLLAQAPEGCFDLIQIPFSVFDGRFLPLLPLLKARGVEVHVRSAFLQGLPQLTEAELVSLFGFAPPQLLAFQQMCAQEGWNLYQAMLAYVAATPGVDVVVVGVVDAAQLALNLEHRALLPLVAPRCAEWARNYVIANDDVVLPFKWKKNKYLEAKKQSAQ